MTSTQKLQRCNCMHGQLRHYFFSENDFSSVVNFLEQHLEKKKRVPYPLAATGLMGQQMYQHKVSQCIREQLRSIKYLSSLVAVLTKTDIYKYVCLSHFTHISQTAQVLYKSHQSHIQRLCACFQGIFIAYAFSV